MNQVNENLKKRCEEAVVAFQKLNKEEYSEIQSNLEWCLGSYNYDKNPEGLFEYSIKSLDTLKKVKSKEPRKVNKKVIDGLEKAILSYNEN
jgi:hypothetical protein